jgi:hypothetical protein
MKYSFLSCPVWGNSMLFSASLYMAKINSYRLVQSASKYLFVLSDILTVCQHGDISSSCNPAINLIVAQKFNVTDVFFLTLHILAWKYRLPVPLKTFTITDLRFSQG